MTRVKIMWGGFVNGKLDCDKDEGIYDTPRAAVFPTKRAAKRTYEDVRRVTIVWSIDE